MTESPLASTMTLMVHPPSQTLDDDDDFCGQIEIMTHETFFSLLQPLLSSLAICAEPPAASSQTEHLDIEDRVRRGIFASLQRWANESEGNTSVFNGIVADVSCALLKFAEAYYVVPKDRLNALLDLERTAKQSRDAAPSAKPASLSGTKMVQAVVAGTKAPLRAAQEFLVEILPVADASVNSVSARPPVSAAAADGDAASAAAPSSPRGTTCDGFEELRRIEHRLRNDRGESLFAPLHYTVDGRHDDVTRVDRREPPVLVTSKDERLLHQLDPLRREFLHAHFGDPALKEKRRKEVLAREMVKFARRTRGVHHVSTRASRGEGKRAASPPKVEDGQLSSALVLSPSDEGIAVREPDDSPPAADLQRFVRPVSSTVAHGGLRNKFSSMFDTTELLDVITRASELELPRQLPAAAPPAPSASTPAQTRWKASGNSGDAFNPIRSRPASALSITAHHLLSQGIVGGKPSSTSPARQGPIESTGEAARANGASFADYIRSKRSSGSAAARPASAALGLTCVDVDGAKGDNMGVISLINANDSGFRQKLDQLVHVYKPGAQTILENAVTMSMVSRPSSALAELPAPSEVPDIPSSTAHLSRGSAKGPKSASQRKKM
jgi:hypothetical protein